MKSKLFGLAVILIGVMAAETIPAIIPILFIVIGALLLRGGENI